MRILISMVGGLVVGAALTWISVRPAPSSQAPSQPRAISTAGGAMPEHARRAATIVLPPHLTAKDASDTLDAYLALPALPDDASPAAYADRSARLRALLTILPDQAFEHLLTALAERTGQAEARLRWIAFDVWIERAPRAAAAWAASLVPSPALPAFTRDRYCAKAVIAWSKLDFDAAYVWANNLEDTALADEVARQFLVDLASADPARAFTLAQARGPQFLRAAQTSIFENWAKIDPAAALQNLGSSLIEDHDYGKLYETVTDWLDRDPTAALAWANDHNADSRWSLLQGWTIGTRLADPRTVANLLASQPDGVNRLGLMADLVDGWSSRDAQAALAWLSALPDVAQRTDILGRISAGLLIDNGHPEAYFDFIALMPAGETKEQRVASSLAYWAGHNPDAALAWLHAHDGPEYAAAVSRVQATLLGSLAASDPQAAVAQWQSLADGDARTAAIPKIVAAWSHNDPAAAAQWLGEQLATNTSDVSPEQLRHLANYGPNVSGVSQSTQNLLWALYSTTYTWSKQDPESAMHWAESLPDPGQRELALRSLGGTWQDAPDRSDYADLLAQVSDAGLRMQMLSEHLKGWLRADIPAARAWIESHDAVPADVAAQLLLDASIIPPPVGYQ